LIWQEANADMPKAVERHDLGLDGWKSPTVVNDVTRYLRVREELEQSWISLCSAVAPHSDGRWRYSRPPNSDDPRQCWKLHVSATILTAANVLEAVAPIVAHSDVLLKTVESIGFLRELNSGLAGDYSQIGKCITVYPRDDDQARELAETLKHATIGFAHPAVPFDLHVGGAVYTRFGVGLSASVLEERFITLPNGDTCKDVRAPGAATPKGMTPPFATAPPAMHKLPDLAAFESLSQRGRGGVYRALDFAHENPLCVFKWGRRNSEVDWIGRDGADAVLHEARVLRLFAAIGLAVPKTRRVSRDGGSVYLIMDEIVGRTLSEALVEESLAWDQRLNIVLQLAQFLDGMHANGWAWRDCKPSNMLLTESGQLVAADFEGAAPIGQGDALPYGTRGYVLPIHLTYQGCSDLVAQDHAAFALSMVQVLDSALMRSTSPLDLATSQIMSSTEMSEIVHTLRNGTWPAPLTTAVDRIAKIL
jgi:hypothetical protein